MAGFDAEKKVDPLKYTFGKGYKYKDREISGVVPEPSDEQLATWHKELAEVARSYRADQEGVDLNDQTAVMDWMANRDPSRAVDMEMDTARIYAEVCSEKPSFDELMAVPPRLRTAFYAWLNGELHPEGSKPGTVSE